MCLEGGERGLHLVVTELQVAHELPGLHRHAFQLSHRSNEVAYRLDIVSGRPFYSRNSGIGRRLSREVDTGLRPFGVFLQHRGGSRGKA